MSSVNFFWVKIFKYILSTVQIGLLLTGNVFRTVLCQSVRACFVCLCNVIFAVLFMTTVKAFAHVHDVVCSCS